MIGAPNTRGQKYWVGIVQWAAETSVSEEIADILTNYYIDELKKKVLDSSSLFEATVSNIFSLYLATLYEASECQGNRLAAG